MKNITLIALLLCSLTTLFAQTPQKMSYQSVIRKADGSLVSNSSVKIKVSILQGSASGTASYVETQTATTNPNGLATLEIGGGTPVTGTFSDINWGSGTYFIKTETDPTGGTNYTISGTSQLLSVPYALYAGNTQNKGKTSIILTGSITNEQAAAQIASEFGPYTENVYIKNTTDLTTVDLSVFTSLVNLDITNNTKLVTLNLNGLTAIYENVTIKENNALTSLSFPVLTKAHDINSGQNPMITSVNFPNLTTVTDDFVFYNCSKLTSIGIPSLQTTGKYISLNSNALSSTQINTILNKILTVNPTSGKYISLSGQTPPAPPTGQGVTDKATLISNGNSVYTD